MRMRNVRNACLCTCSLSPYERACIAFHSKDYDCIIPLLNDELADESSEYIAESHLLIASFHYITGSVEVAQDHFEECIAMETADKRVGNTTALHTANWWSVYM